MVQRVLCCSQHPDRQHQRCPPTACWPGLPVMPPHKPLSHPFLLLEQGLLKNQQELKVSGFPSFQPHCNGLLTPFPLYFSRLQTQRKVPAESERIKDHLLLFSLPSAMYETTLNRPYQKVCLAQCFLSDSGQKVGTVANKDAPIGYFIQLTW